MFSKHRAAVSSDARSYFSDGRSDKRRTALSFSFLIAAILLAAVSACGHDDDDDHHGGALPQGVSTKATCPTPQTLTYANFGQSFMKNNCLRCHSTSVKGEARKGAPDDHNFDLVDDIRALANHIDQYAGSGPSGTNEIMPKDDPKPSTEDRRKLSEWLACGAP